MSQVITINGEPVDFNAAIQHLGATSPVLSQMAQQMEADSDTMQRMGAAIEAIRKQILTVDWRAIARNLVPTRPNGLTLMPAGEALAMLHDKYGIEIGDVEE